MCEILQGETLFSLPLPFPLSTERDLKLKFDAPKERKRGGSERTEQREARQNLLLSADVEGVHNKSFRINFLPFF